MKDRKHVRKHKIKWKGNIPSGRRRPRGLVKGGKGALPISAGPPAQFLEIIKNSFFLKFVRQAMTLY